MDDSFRAAFDPMRGNSCGYEVLDERPASFEIEPI